jgi:hypothetical protein
VPYVSWGLVRETLSSCIVDRGHVFINNCFCREMEFALNIIFFITVPSLMFWDAVKRILCRAVQTKVKTKRSTETKKCFSTHDMQV